MRATYKLLEKATSNSAYSFRKSAIKCKKSKRKFGITPEEIEKERAKLRQLAAQNNDAGRAVVENLPQQSSTGKSRDIATAKVGMSGKTAEKAANSDF